MDARTMVAPLAGDIRLHADAAEAERRLPEVLMSRLMEAGLFSIYTPKQFGGMELSLPEALSVVEEVSRHDGSAGWTVALGFGNDLFTSILSEAAAARVLGSGSALVAGSPGFGVRAVPVDGGYRLTGQWQFASGAPNAHWLNVLAPVFDGDAPRLGPGGMPETVMAFLPPGDVEIVDTWHVTGLRASGSHDLRVNNAFVPKEMTGGFSLMGPQVRRPSTLAMVPFTTLLAMVQAPPVCLGIARHVIDAFKSLAAQKERPPSPRLDQQSRAQSAVARAEALVRSARLYFYAAAQMAWDRASAGGQLSLEERVDVRMASLTAVENATAAVDSLRRLAGSTAVFESCELERPWRDIHTAAQHVQVQDGRWETAGRILLGLEPADMWI